jgi:hypothetical protein
MRIRLLALVGVLGVLGGMMNADWLSSQTAKTRVQADATQASFDDPFPPPTPRP